MYENDYTADLIWFVTVFYFSNSQCFLFLIVYYVLYNTLHFLSYTIHNEYGLSYSLEK